jgi:WD40 repeat protein
MLSSKKRKLDAEKIGTKQQPSLIFHSSFAWSREYLFEQIALLEDGVHFAAIRFSLSGNKLEIWNIQNRTCLFTHPTLTGCALTLLKDDRLAITSADNNICLYKIDLQNLQLELLTFFTPDLPNIHAMTMLQDNSLVVGSLTGSISIWNLDTQEKTASFQAGSAPITALDTRKDGSLVIAGDNGFIFIYDLNNNKEIHKFNVNASMPKAITLPDDTVVCSDSDGFIHHLNFTESNPTRLHTQKISEFPITQLISMPNGLIGCFVEWNQCYYLSFFKPSWVREFLNKPSPEETTKVLLTHLPMPLTELVGAYAANITLFRSPKLPNKEKCFSEEPLPALQSKNTLTTR